MVEEYKRIIGDDAKVIATGGLTNYFEGKISSIDVFEPDLIFYGLKIIFDIITSLE